MCALIGLRRGGSHFEITLARDFPSQNENIYTARGLPCRYDGGIGKCLRNLIDIRNVEESFKMTGTVVDYKKIALCAGRHAIESASFSIAFSDQLSRADFARFDEKTPVIMEEFPSIQPMEAITLKVSPDQHAFSREEKGRELSEFGRDGKKLWSGRFFENSVQITCHEYSGWRDVWQSVEKKLPILLNCVDQKKEVISIDFAVVDEFATQISEMDLTPSVVLKNDSKYISPKMLEITDSRWDLQQGWFEPLDDHSSRLTRLDCRSVRRNDQYVTTVQNVLSMRSNGPNRPLSEYLSEKDGENDLARLFREFHDQNKKILRELIVDGLLRRMGLSEE